MISDSVKECNSRELRLKFLEHNELQINWVKLMDSPRLKARERELIIDRDIENQRNSRLISKMSLSMRTYDALSSPPIEYVVKILEEKGLIEKKARQQLEYFQDLERGKGERADDLLLEARQQFENNGSITYKIPKECIFFKPI
jgi:hypothetical protein